MKISRFILFILSILLIMIIFTNCAESKEKLNPGKEEPKEDDPPDEEDPIIEDILLSVSAGNLNIDYTGYYPITFVIQPPSLQDKVTVQYLFINQAHSEHLELFNSSHEEYPNSVRAKSNTSGTYSLIIRASYGGINRNSQFTITVSLVEYPPETTKDLTDQEGQTIAALASLYDASALNCNVNPIDNINTFSKEYLDNYIRGVDISSLISTPRI